MHEIAHIRKLSLWIFLIPFLAVNLCLIISQNPEFFENTIFTVDQIGRSGFSIPYLDGSLSISRASRTFPQYLIFKPAMILTAIFLYYYWTNNNNQSIWTFNDDKDGAYLEVYISGYNCYTYENNFIVNAEFKYQTKLNLSEDFNGSNWFYSIVNDSVIEKTKSTGGSTIYFYKTDKSYLDDLLELDECNY